MLLDGISVVVPLFNTDIELFKMCISSILNQTYSNFEVIVINDGSCKNYSIEYEDLLKGINDNRISYLKNNNNGVSYTRNVGIKLAKKKYITFIDSDDIITSNFFLDAINFMEQNNLDGVLGGVRKEFKKEREDLLLEKLDNIIFKQEELYLLVNKIIAYESRDTLNINNCFFSGCVAKLFKTELVKKIKFSETLKIGEDVIFNIDYLKECKTFGIVKELFYIYYIRDNSAVTKYREDLIDQSCILFNEMKKRIDNTNINYLYYRILKQYNWIMYSYIFHKNCNMSFIQKYYKIKELYNINIFKEAFENIYIKELLMKSTYKLMYYVIKGRFFLLATIMFQINNSRRSKK